MRIGNGCKSSVERIEKEIRVMSRPSTWSYGGVIESRLHQHVAHQLLLAVAGTGSSRDYVSSGSLCVWLACER